RIVALVAGVFKNRILTGGIVDYRCPWSFPGGGIFHGKFILQNIIRYTCITFSEGTVGACTTEGALVREVAALYHQGVAFPPAACVSVPEFNTFIQRWFGFQRNDTYVVDHFLDDGHRGAALHNLVITVIPGHDVGHAPGNT